MGSGGGAGQNFVFAGQFFIEDAHLAEEFEGGLGAFAVDFGEGKANVDNGVVSDLDFGDVVKADALDDAAEVDASHAEIAFGGDFFDSSGNGQAHRTYVYTAFGNGTA